MNYTYLHYQIGLSLLNGVGPIKARQLVRSVENSAQIYHSDYKSLSKLTGFKEEFLRRMNRKSALDEADRLLEYYNKHGVAAVSMNDEVYPYRLREILDAPPVLFHKGNTNFNNRRTIAIVGTRNASNYGLGLVKECIEQIAEIKPLVISGLAHGIDTAVHKSCVLNEVPTLGVLGHGLDRIYPQENRSLAVKMIKNGGLLTEFVPNTKPDRENFPKRNRIVAGMSDATIVIESKESGGSLITARLANEYNRDVFAFPGDVNRENSQGCNNLIRDNKAHLIQSPKDFIQLMEWTEPTKRKAFQTEFSHALSDIQKSIIKRIRLEEKVHIDALVAQLKKPIHEINNELFQLELEGVIRPLPGQQFEVV